MESFNLIQYQVLIYKCHCELPKHVKAFTLPGKLRMLELISPIKFAQLVLLILFLPVIFPVPQNKIIYTGGGPLVLQRGMLLQCARLSYALKCQQNPSTKCNRQKSPLYVPTSSGKRAYCLWLRTTDMHWFLWHYFDC